MMTLAKFNIDKLFQVLLCISICVDDDNEVILIALRSVLAARHDDDDDDENESVKKNLLHCLDIILFTRYDAI